MILRLKIFNNSRSRFSGILILAMLLCYSDYSGNLNGSENSQIRIELLQDFQLRETCTCNFLSNLYPKKTYPFIIYFNSHLFQLLNHHSKEKTEVLIFQNRVYASLKFRFNFFLTHFFSSTNFEQLS